MIDDDSNEVHPPTQSQPQISASISITHATPSKSHIVESSNLESQESPSQENPKSSSKTEETKSPMPDNLKSPITKSPVNLPKSPVGSKPKESLFSTEVLTKLNDATNLKPITHKGYNPLKDAIFNKGDPVPFSFLANGFEEVSKCKGENSKDAQKNILSNIFKTIILLRPDQLIMAYYLCILKTAPDYVPSELGIGNEILTKSISKVTGRSEKQIRDSFNKVYIFKFKIF